MPQSSPPATHTRPISIATTSTDRTISELTPAEVSAGPAAIDQAITSYYEHAGTKRAYVMTDKPLYQPGETMWFRADLRATGTLVGGAPIGVTMTLTSPRGAIVAQKRVLAQGGVARNDFALAPEIEGGEYKLTMAADDGTRDVKTIVINTYEAPRLQKSVELLRKAYGEGDRVTAAIEIKRATGEPLADHELVGVVSIDDVELPRLKLTTDDGGKATARFSLPASIARGDGLLTILVDDGGVTESIQKRIPIVLHKVDVALYPESGDLIDGVPGRVYFTAKTPLGKPADIEGEVVDDRGRTVTRLSSIHDGMGRFELVPATDRTYSVRITKPAGIAKTFDVPASKPGGCVVRSVDQTSAKTLRVGAICNTSRRLSLVAVLREKQLASGSFDVVAGEPTLVELPVDPARQGVVRVTLFDQRHTPLAERLTYHALGADLKISITADKKSYSPRDPVKLAIRTTDAAGRPVAADVGLAVVDETVLAFADDKSGQPAEQAVPRARARRVRRGSDRGTHVLLRPYARRGARDGCAARDPGVSPIRMAARARRGRCEMNRSTIAKWMFAAATACAAGAMVSLSSPTVARADTAGTIEGSVVDAAGKVMSGGVRISVTCGSTHRSTAPDGAGHFSISGLPAGTCTLVATGGNNLSVSMQVAVAGGSIATVLVSLVPPMPVPETEPAVDMAEAPAAAMPRHHAPRRLMKKPMPAPAIKGGALRPPPPPPKVMRVVQLDGLPKRKLERQQLAAGDDAEDIGNNEIAIAGNGYAPVRVFPVPKYPRHYAGPRTDFRETIYWNPSVRTDASGRAEVEFPTSDAVTAFRVTAEGFSKGGTPGTGQLAIRSKLPVSLDAHLPVEVTAGDVVRLPVTIENTTESAIDATLAATFGSALSPISNPIHGPITVAAGGKRTLVFPLRVAPSGTAEVSLAVDALGLEDKVEKTIRVVPKGFPFEVSSSGTLARGQTMRRTIDLSGALAHSIRPTITVYPSPVASMTQGMAGMIREPGGCFEQTSSTNYPNVMILAYLQSADANVDAQLVDQTQGKLARGYKLLTGYETPQKGYEWFGKTPGHEALTAYGLMEFADMAKVYDVDHAMVERTAKWLMGRRDGKGGFARSSTALDSFGRANETTTNAYIVWALAEAHRTGDLDRELAVQRKLGLSTKDPYLLGLAANTFLAVAPKSKESQTMVRRLVGMQKADGSFPGAAQSITMSGGDSLTIETTALAALALIESGDQAGEVRKAVEYLNAHRGGYGQWGNTQATVLGLKALTAYSESARKMAGSGKVTLLVNGNTVKTIEFAKGQKAALVWDDFARTLKAGKNTIELSLDSEADASLPFTIGVEYRSARPQSSPDAKVEIATKLAKTRTKMGEGLTLRAHVENKTAGGLPMTIARIGIPGGTVFQTWQLKELRDKGKIDFYETRPREVIVYWRALPPNAKRDVDIQLLAAVPGAYEAPASSAYLYYTAEDKAWTAPVRVKID